MADIAWLLRRLRAMSVPEIIWRLSQKTKNKKEQYQFGSSKLPVTDCCFNRKYKTLRLNADRMHLNMENTDFQLLTSIPLLGGYCYEDYKKEWNAGFQTPNNWPETFSYLLEYKQRDDIGDARTNWELNRHFQFAVLAKNFWASGDIAYLQEFEYLFHDWNEKNPFLWGISWTSVMEIAIRCSNWCYAYCFLANADVSQTILDQMRIGIVNMAGYIAQHYSRYSSANNHLIVEAYAVGQAGILCCYEPWITSAIKILTQELARQNYPDGINKELSLHYQSFYMEAMGLIMRLMVKNNIEIPKTWTVVLDKMCQYLSTCIGEKGEVVVFGDDDEGKILDLGGGIEHYSYVLGLFSCLLDKRYITKVKCCENLAWLFAEKELNCAQNKELFIPPLSACYKEGGNTILYSTDRRILIGIDHAALGFGSIAAHGHADALSFQLFADGIPIFVDPGTYIYHCDIKSRNEYRKTENHNTVCIDGRDQSTMLGAFLWGHKAKCELLDFKVTKEQIILEATQDGYYPVIHTRKFVFDKKGRLEITDTFSEYGNKTINFLFSPAVSLSVSQQNILFEAKTISGHMSFESKNEVIIERKKKHYSGHYATQTTAPALCIKFSGLCVKTSISIDSIGG